MRDQAIDFPWSGIDGAELFSVSLVRQSKRRCGQSNRLRCRLADRLDRLSACPSPLTSVSNGQNAFYPTFAGFRGFPARIAPYRLEQRQFVLVASKVRSKPPIEGTEALHRADSGTPAQTSPIAACRIISTLLMPARAARSRAISNRMSANICRAATSAIVKMAMTEYRQPSGALRVAWA